jgi:transcriptional regulator with XRE-family HTH domain
MNADWFAGRLRELREAKGLSREQLAEAAGMKVGGVRDLEQGVRSPAWKTVLALCQALGVSCEEFTREPAHRPPPSPGRPRKEGAVPLDLHATESAPLESAPGQTPTKKGRAGRLPGAQEKPRGRKTRRPRGG